MLSDLGSFLTGDGTIFWIGIIIAVVGFCLAAAGRGKAVRSFLAVALVGVVIAVLGVGIAALTVAPSSSVAPVSGASVSTLLATSPALVTGETWTQGTSTLLVTLAYNTTGSYYCVVSTGATTHGCATGGAGNAAHPLDVLLPLKLIRTDALNTTALFNVGVTSVPTAVSLGSTPTTYSIIGFKGATSTTPGQWQIYNSAGTLASQYPTVSAPSVSTNLITDGVAVTAFGSTADTLHFHLAGTNSTSAPESFASALQNYTIYPMTVSLSQSVPSLVTIDLEVICWTT